MSDTVKCVKCEAPLGRPKKVDPERYNLVPNKHGAVVRVCGDCGQLWLGYVQELQNGGIKIIMKSIDKVL